MAPFPAAASHWLSNTANWSLTHDGVRSVDADATTDGTSGGAVAIKSPRTRSSRGPRIRATYLGARACDGVIRGLVEHDRVGKPQESIRDGNGDGASKRSG